MRVAVIGLIIVAASKSAAAIEVGDQAVVVQPVEMGTITASTLVLTPGTSVTVREVKDKRLKVAAGRVGWIEENAVIAADRADEYFSALIEKNGNDRAALLARGKLRFDKAVVDAEKL